MGSKRVVVVHDTSKEVNWAAIRGVLHNLCLKAGDELILLGVVHQFNNSTAASAFLGTVKLPGQRNRVDHKVMEEELVKRMEIYNKSLEMLMLLKQCEVQKNGKFQHNILVIRAPVYELPAYCAGNPTRKKFQHNILEIGTPVY